MKRIINLLLVLLVALLASSCARKRTFDLTIATQGCPARVSTSVGNYGETPVTLNYTLNKKIIERGYLSPEDIYLSLENGGSDVIRGLKVDLKRFKKSATYTHTTPPCSPGYYARKRQEEDRARRQNRYNAALREYNAALKKLDEARNAADMVDYGLRTGAYSGSKFGRLVGTASSLASGPAIRNAERRLRMAEIALDKAQRELYQ